MSLIKIDGLKRHYEMTSGTVKALDGIDIEIEQGERVILLGPSGSGKELIAKSLHKNIFRRLHGAKAILRFSK